MSLISAFRLLVNEYNDARSRYVTARQIGALPFEVQKDIGWPPVEAPYSSGVGHWVGAK